VLFLHVIVDQPDAACCRWQGLSHAALNLDFMESMLAAASAING
jgi:hypothetical protein